MATIVASGQYSCKRVNVFKVPKSTPEDDLINHVTPLSILNGPVDQAVYEAELRKIADGDDACASDGSVSSQSISSQSISSQWSSMSVMDRVEIDSLLEEYEKIGGIMTMTNQDMRMINKLMAEYGDIE